MRGAMWYVALIPLEERRAHDPMNETLKVAASPFASRILLRMTRHENHVTNPCYPRILAART